MSLTAVVLSGSVMLTLAVNLLPEKRPEIVHERPVAHGGLPPPPVSFPVAAT
jgi:hypothetical protein